MKPETKIHDYPFTVRAANTLYYVGIDGGTLADLKAAIESGKVSMNLRNVGTKTMREFCRAAGVEFVKPRQIHPSWKFNPWTGEVLK